MTVSLSLLAGAGWQFFDDNGNPLSGGLLYTYEAGTTTPQTTYTDSNGNVANANPIVLDAAGRVPYQVWLIGTATYKFILKTSTGVTVWSEDDVPGYGSSADIIFLQAGTGAVARTVQSKLRETISLADFGAVGNGVADDTVAIQTAINALGALGQGRIIGTSGASYKITDTIDFTILGNTHNWYEIDFAGAEFTWYGSQVGADPMFYFYNNKAVKVQNFTLIANPVASISATVKGIRVDSLQPDGADLLVFADFKIRLANLAVDLGSVGVDQNRVSDCRFEHFLIETCSVGIQTNSTNCDSLIFTNGQLSGCTFGFNFVRAGFNKIDTCIGYECDAFIRVAGPIGPLTVINSQSEPQTLPAGDFLYRKIYTLARNSPINLIGCNINERIFLDYDAGLGSDIQTLNIVGGYFSTLTVDAPDSRINLIGTTQYTGTTFTLAGANSRCYSIGSQLDGTLTDTANGYIAVGTSVKYPVTTGGLALAPAFSAYKNANQSIAAYTPTVIAFQVEEFDTGSYYDNATNYWFAPKVAGYYQVNWGVLLNDLLNSYYSELYKNGVSYKAGSNAQPPFPNPGTTNQLTGSALVYLNGTTDYIQVLVTSTGSGQVNGNAQSSFFQAVMVRGA